MTIAELLTVSMAEHEAARADRHRKAKVSARTHLERAYRLRLDAHQSDPAHTDPAWADEQAMTPTGRDTHAEMVMFYEQQLGPML